MALSTFSIKNAADQIKTFVVETIGSDLHEITKVAFGGDDTATRVTSSVGLPTQVVSALPTGANVIGKVDLNASLPAGTNNIGDVDIASALPAGTNNIGDVDLASPIPAGSNLIGSADLGSVPASSRSTDTVAAAPASDAIMDGFTSMPPKKAFVNLTASSTDTNLVTAVASRRIVVTSYRLSCTGAKTLVTFNSKGGGAGTAITENFTAGADGGGRESAGIPWGHFWTTIGEGLTVSSGAGSTVGVGITYVEKTS